MIAGRVGGVLFSNIVGSLFNYNFILAITLETTIKKFILILMQAY